MKRLLLPILLISVLIFSCKDDDVVEERVYLEKDTDFDKTYGGTANDESNSIVEKDGFLYLFGYSNSFVDPNGDHYLIKTDLEGNVVWEKTYGSSSLEQGFKIVKSTDGNFFLLGITERRGGGDRDIHLLKVNTDGTVLWEKVIGGAMQEIPSTLIETSSSEILIAATTESLGNGARDMYLIWLDQQGAVLKERTYGQSGGDGGTDILEVENSNLIFFGYTSSYDAVSRDFYLLKLTANGDSIWGKRYGGNGYEETHKLLQTANGNFLLHGHTTLTDPNHNMYSVLVDSSGNIIWEREFGGSQHDGGMSALINYVGNFILLGRSMSFGEQRQMLFAELGQNGNLIAQEDIGNPKDDWGNEIIEVGNSYYIIGHTDNFSSGDNDSYLIRKLK
ncbi:MAG: hypothetical protein ACJAV5_001756 [Vicingaceae bacterium]